MIAKALELRDEGTFIPILCVNMNPSPFGGGYEAQLYLLRRCGYACDDVPNVIMTRLDGSGHATNDPYDWKGERTYMVAHNWIIDNWSKLCDGDVVDVQWILGETPTPKRSERETA